MPQPVSTWPVKKTVSTYWYCLLLRWKTPSQNFWTLFTTATMRQSSRVFASWPVLQVGDRAQLGVSPCPTCWLSSGASWPRAAAAVRKNRDQDVDDEADEPEPTAADSDAARAAQAAAADVGNLCRVERGITSEPHGGSLACASQRQTYGSGETGWYHRRAAAVEVCEPRQGREAAALSIPSRRRG